MLAATSHAEASAIRFAVEEKRVSLQAWAITPKIREVDALLRENVRLRERVIEVHPEMSFQSMNGGVPLRHSKKRAAGRRERLALLAPHVGVDLEEVLRARNIAECERDDVLDAFAAAWTAERLVTKRAAIIPIRPETDTFGLPMRITA
jgi:predicted RNase H-like nuclease